MDKCLGIINLSPFEQNFSELCSHRPQAMLPFAGRYRIIDFTLSNMVNGGINGIGIFTGNKIRSLMRHISFGDTWRINNNTSSIAVLPPNYDEDLIYNNKGTVNEYKKNEDFFLDNQSQYLFFSSTSFVGNIDIADAYHQFLKSNSDISFIVKKIKSPNENFQGCKQFALDKEKKLRRVGIYIGNSDDANIYTDMFFIKKRVFFEILDQAVEIGSEIDFQDVLFKQLKKYRVNVYEFNKSIEYIPNIKSYYEANMKVLDPSYSYDLFYNRRQIYTKSMDEPPTYYHSGAKISNSFVANGCIVNGTVENSILFRGVKIAKETIVKNSIIMQNAKVMENSHIENIISDKQTTIGPGISLIGSKAIPYVVGKKQIVAVEKDNIKPISYKVAGEGFIL